MLTTREAVAKSTSAIENVFRDEHARLFASLVRVLGSFDEAEDALQQAFAAAAESWEKEGIPETPGAWIATVAKNAGISAKRRRAVAERERAAVEHHISQPQDDADDRLRLVFTCCHPALAVESSIALALRNVCGLTTPSIAKLLLIPETTLAQRLVRAKRKIEEARIPYVVPDAEHLDDRIEAVLHVVYLMFTEGYAPVEGEVVVNAALCEEAIRMARLLTLLLPSDGETRGLLALMLLHHARRHSRVDAHGDIVPLDEQDRSTWDRAAIAEGTRELEEALAKKGAGPYRIEAAVAALHAQADRADETDFPQIASLYQELFARAPSAPVAINWCLALGRAIGADVGLAKLEQFERAGSLVGSDRVAAARAELSRRAGKIRAARDAYRAAIDVARNERERRFLSRRVSELDESA